MMRKIVYLLLLLSPLQHCLASASKHFDRVSTFHKKRNISPFELPSVSISYFGFKYNKFEKGFVKNLGVELPDHKENPTAKGYAIYLDRPIYKKYISCGYTLGFNYKFPKYGQRVEEERSDSIEKETRSGLLATAYTHLSLRFRLPFPHMPIGDLAITVAGHGGLTTVIGAHCGNRLIEPRLGFLYGASAGIEYYPIKWLGMFFEVESHFYNYLNNKYDWFDNFSNRGIDYEISELEEFGGENPYMARRLEELKAEKIASGKLNKKFSFNTGLVYRFGVRITY